MAYQARAGVDLTEALKALKDLPRKLKKKAIRQVANAGAKKLKWAARKLVPIRHGLLKKSLGQKVKVYPSGVAVGMVGAREGFKQQVGVRKQDSRPGARYPKKAGDPVYANPTKYLHLVELGTRRGAKARHFLRRALDQSVGAVRAEAVEILDRAVKEALR